MEDRPQPEVKDCIEICESRIRLGFASICATTGSLGGLVMLASILGASLGLLGRPPTSSDFPVLVIGMLLGVAGFVLFGSDSVQMVQRLLGAPTPVVFVARDGFKDLRISTQWIPWSAILSLKDPRGGK